MNTNSKRQPAKTIMGSQASPWVSVEERMPTEDETIDGRLPVIDKSDFLVYGMLVGNTLLTSSQEDAVYWLPVVPPSKS